MTEPLPGSMDPSMRSAANYVAPPKKNPYLLKIAKAYNKIPMGVREFVLVGPLLVITLAITYFSPQLFPMDKLTGGLQPHQQDMKEYTLEPMYDERGNLKGYRHINNKSNSVA